MQLMCIPILKNHSCLFSLCTNLINIAEKRLVYDRYGEGDLDGSAVPNESFDYARPTQFRVSWITLVQNSR